MPLLTPKSIAEMTQLSPRYIARVIARGELGTPVRFGKAIRIPQSRVFDWISQRSQQAK
jgi:excisionase family DNA binding protein